MGTLVYADQGSTGDGLGHRLCLMRAVGWGRALHRGLMLTSGKQYRTDLIVEQPFGSTENREFLARGELARACHGSVRVSPGGETRSISLRLRRLHWRELEATPGLTLSATPRNTRQNRT